jgi:hypothetical protein
MKNYALILTLLLALPAYSAQFGNLLNGQTYSVCLDRAEIGTQLAQNNSVSVDLPRGMHLIAVSLASSIEPTPEPSITPAPTAEPSDGIELFLAGFDEVSSSNRFQVLDRSGNSLTGIVPLLENVDVPAHIVAADLDDNGSLEVLAAGYHETEGVLLEIRGGDGALKNQIDVFPASFANENYLLAGNIDGYPGQDAILIGRDESGAYQLRAIDSMGTTVSEYEALPAGYTSIDTLFTADVDGDNADEVVVLARNEEGLVDLVVLGSGAVETSTLVFGNGYTGPTTAFELDVNGDGAREIAAVRQNSRTRSYRLLVVDGHGALLMKKNLLGGKFDPRATFTAADIDGDGADEITAIGRLTESGENVVQMIDNDGSQIFASEVLDPALNGATASVFADIDSNGGFELVVGGQDSLLGNAAYEIVAADGSILASWNAFLAGTSCDPEIFSADLDQDGDDDILVLGHCADGFGLELRDGNSGDLQFTTSLDSLPSTLTTGNLI